MLKVILMLDCNECGQPFDRVATSTDCDPLAWKPLACALKYSAQRSGWSFQRGAHYCDYCDTDGEFSPQELVLAVADQEEPDF